jgi:hypothetical protein
VSTKAERRAAYQQVTTYHDAVGGTGPAGRRGVDRHRGGELDAFEVDQVIFQYQRAARQLWTFCQTTGSRAEFTAHIIRRMAEDSEAIDWWERGQPHRRR